MEEISVKKNSNVKLRMHFSPMELFDLPDEIFVMIFKKLENVELLYSLMDITMRLDQIVTDPIFTTQITLINQPSLLELISPLPDIVLDRFCLQILPKIHDKIKWLKVETSSMERILLAANNYSNLHQLDIFIMNNETDMHLFTNESPLMNIFQNQIVTLNINGKEDVLRDHLKISRPGNNFLNILNMCQKLRHLEFYASVPVGSGYISFGQQPPMFSASTLVQLHMTVYRFDECLYLLDGRLNQLRVLFVTTFHILPLERTTICQEKLPNLKHFSLTCRSEIFVYDELVVPHLQRMINLERLALYFVTDIHETFIDGNNLKKNFINHMSHLNQFIFNIRSIIHFVDQIHLPSNEDIHQTFSTFKDYQIITCVDYFPKAGYSQCHIYSYPYTLTHYDNVTNNLPDGLFNTVQQIELYDERCFEHEFFIKISQSFLFLKKLIIINSQPQKSNNENRNFSIIEYLHLTKLHLLCVHDDYVEQFLFDTKTYLSNYIRLGIGSEQLQRVTQNFTRNATRNNCSKVKELFSCDLSQLPQHYNTYFPHLEQI